MGKARLLSILSVANIIVLLINIVASAYFITNSAFDRQTSERFPLLSKRIFAEDPNDLILNFVALREELNTYLKPYGDTVGMYFEYLPSGVSIGINERKEIRLASLGKVPTVMAAQKIQRQGLLTDDTKIVISEEYKDRQFGSLWQVPTGSTVSLGEIMRLTIVESDNTAHNALLDTLPPEEINRVYSSLDIAFNSRDGYPIISAKNYSSILRSLFLSSYLPKDDSQEILHTMTETIYRDKIPALLPSDVKVAHKVGVYETKGSGSSSFSDCGIVYPAKRPYLLCIMVDGTDIEAQTVISRVSKTIYDYVTTAE